MRRQRLHVICAVFFMVMLLHWPAVNNAQEKPLILGLHPYLSSTELYKRFGPLADHLSRQLQRPVKISIANSYESHITKAGKGNVDIAFMGPASYVKMTGRYGKVPLLAAFETNGNKTFRGVIITMQDSPVKTLVQLRGKKFAFGDVNSTMSHLVPRYMLLNAGVDVKHLAKYDFLTNHENIALGVLSGKYDAGAIKEDIYTEYAKQGLIALAVSVPLPDHIFVARTGLPDDTVQKISNIFQSLKDTEDGRSVLGSLQKTLTALVPVKDGDYKILRQYIDSLRKAGVKP